MSHADPFNRHLSYFEPYESKKPWHEDQLTRAYLTVLRLIPAAHADFVEQVHGDQLAKQCRLLLPLDATLGSNQSEIFTQVVQVPRTSGQLVSVLLSDEYWTKDTKIHRVPRGARYDGLICYPDNWIVTIENKPRVYSVWEDQLRPSLPDGSHVQCEQKVVSLSWREIILRLGQLLMSGGLNPTEELLLRDFLTFVDRHFEYLKPYGSFTLCGDSVPLLNSRCRDLLGVLGKVERHWGWGHVVRIDGSPLSEIKLEAREPEGQRPVVALRLCSGVGCPSSRQMMDNIDLDALLKLGVADGWTIRPSLSFRYRGAGYVWSSSAYGWDISKYVLFWRDGSLRPRRYSRDDTGFCSLFDRLLKAGVIGEKDLPGLHKNFSDTRRSFIEICAGIDLTFSWPLEKAVALDDRKGEFASDMLRRLGQAMQAWHQVLPSGQTDS